MLNKHQKVYLWHVWGRGEGAYRVFVGNLRQRDFIKNLGINERIPLKGDGGPCTGLIRLRIWTSGRLL